MIGPIGIGACGSDRGATDQRERGDEAAAPALGWRVVVQFLIVPIRGGGVVRIVRTLMRSPRSTHGLCEVLLITIEAFRGDLRRVMITAVRRRMLFVPIVPLVPIVPRARVVGTEPGKVHVARCKLIKRRAQA